MASSRNEHVRFRYGMCLNDSCPKCKSKEVQQVSAHKQLVCAECGKPLRECPRPQSWWEKHGTKVIGGGLATAVVAVGLFFGFSGNGSEADGGAGPVQEPPVVNQDSLQLAEQAAEKARRETEQRVKDSLLRDSWVKDSLQRAEQEAEQRVKDSLLRDSLVKDSIKRVQEERKKPIATGTTPIQNGHGTINLPYGKYVGDIRNGKPDGAGVLTYTRSQKVVSTKDVVAQPGERIEGVFENGKATFVTLYKKDGNTVKVKR